MIRNHIVFAVISVLSVLVVGCSIIGSGPVESPQVQQSQPSAGTNQSIDTRDEPAEIDSSNVEPSVRQISQIENPVDESVDMPEKEPVDSDIEPVQITAEESEIIRPDGESAVSFHDKSSGILKEYVDERGMVDYKTLRRRRLELRAVLREFNRLDPKEYKAWPEPDKIAFWINVYNLHKLSVVTDHYPIKPSSRFHVLYYWSPSSIRHIEAEITKYKFFVMNEEFTFAEIERRFFRHQFDDPRIFFAITNACLSSPPLRNEPYYGYKLDEQLEDHAKKFLASPLAFKIDRREEKVYLSAMFQLSSFGGEFIEKFSTDKKFKEQSAATRAVLNFITNYIPGRDVSFLEVRNYSIVYMSYDWTINDGS